MSRTNPGLRNRVFIDGRRWTAHEVAPLVVLAAGLAAVVAGVQRVGIGIAVGAGALFALERTGALETRYQRAVKRVLRPLGRASVRDTEVHTNLDHERHVLTTLRPPPEWKDAHRVLKKAVDDVFDSRSRELSGRRVGSASAAVQVSRIWADLKAFDSRQCVQPEAARTYLATVGETLRTIRGKQLRLADAYQDTVSAVVDGLRDIAPPPRRRAAHAALCDELLRMKAVIAQRDTWLANGDSKRAWLAEQELRNNQQRIATAIRGIRTWMLP